MRLGPPHPPIPDEPGDPPAPIFRAPGELVVPSVREVENAPLIRTGVGPGEVDRVGRQRVVYFEHGRLKDPIRAAFWLHFLPPASATEPASNAPLPNYADPVGLLARAVLAHAGRWDTLANSFPDPNPAWGRIMADTFEELEGSLRTALREGQADTGRLIGAALVAPFRNERGQRTILGKALGDLAVSGYHMRSRFAANPPSVAEVVARVVALRGTGEDIRGWAESVLTRAYDVLWAIEGYGGAIARQRLEYIAVSGEDDPPSRPVNMPGATFLQHSLYLHLHPRRGPDGQEVRVSDTERHDRNVIFTRYMFTTHGFRRLRREADPFTLPPEPEAFSVDRAERFILFIHGHSSRMEECTSLVEPLRQHGFTIISVDLPCVGYASRFDHRQIAPDDNSADLLVSFPILGYIEAFVVRFVGLLEQQFRGIDKQIVAVMGGSLGGNTSLRLGYQAGRDGVDIAKIPFLLNAVPWSPAGAWTSYVGDPTARPSRTDTDDMLDAPDAGASLRTVAASETRSAMAADPPPDHPTPGFELLEHEPPSQRGSYFRKTFYFEFPMFQLRPQAQYWYRDNWPHKEATMRAAREDRFESYGRSYRRMHWRIAYEQVIFSHRSDQNWRRIRARTLLATGEGDNYTWTNIYDATSTLAKYMLTTPGARLLLSNTGHSIYVERPNLFGRLIASFLPPRHPDGEGLREVFSGWENLGGELQGAPAVANHADGRLEVVALWRDNKVRGLTQSTLNGEWPSVWNPIDSGLEDGDRLAASLSLILNREGNLELFARLDGANRAIRVTQTEPNGHFGAWNRGSALIALVGDAEDALAVIGTGVPADVLPPPPGSPHPPPQAVFPDWVLLIAAVRSNGRVHVRHLAGGHDGQDLPANSASARGRPAVANHRDGRVEILIRGNDNVVRRIGQARRGGWRVEWTELSGSVSSDPVVALTIDGRLEAFARSAEGRLVHAFQLDADGDTWVAWRDLLDENRDPMSLAEDSKPTVVLNGWGQLQVFIRAANGSIKTLRQRPRKAQRPIPRPGENDPRWTWGTWQDLGGSSTKDPVVAQQHDGRVVLLAVDAEGQLRMRRQDTAFTAPTLYATRIIPAEIAAGAPRNVAVEIVNQGIDLPTGVKVLLYYARSRPDGSVPEVKPAELGFPDAEPAAESEWHFVARAEPTLMSSHARPIPDRVEFTWEVPEDVLGSIELIAIVTCDQDAPELGEGQVSAEHLAEAFRLVAHSRTRIAQEAVYIRDGADDDGKPAAVAWGARSPDIIVTTSPIDPFETNASPGTGQARAGTNHVHVRIWSTSREGQTAEVRLFQVPLDQLVPASGWTAIGSTETLDLAARGAAVAHFEWSGVTDPSPERSFVLLVVLRVTNLQPGREPPPDITTATSIEDFWQRLRRSPWAALQSVRFLPPE